MSLLKRRILALFFITLFFALLPPLIMITSGQLYNVKKKKFEKTGLLVVSSDPPGANILLDGEIPYTWFTRFFKNAPRKDYRTPKRLNYVLPGNYGLAFEKEGFYPWRTTVSVLSGKTTFIENVRLWSEDRFQELLVTTSPVLTVHPLGTYAAHWNGSEGITVIDTVNKETVWNKPVKEQPLLYWHPQAPLLLLLHKSGGAIIDPVSRAEKKVFIPQDARVQWSPHVTEKFYWSKGDTIFETDTRGNVRTLFKGQEGGTPILDWKPYDDSIFIITAGKLTTVQGNVLSSVYAPQGVMLERILEITDDLLIVATKNSGIFSLGIDDDTWEVLTSENVETLHTTFDNVRKEYWWWNDFEIGTISQTDGRVHTVTRVSSPIRDMTIVTSKTERTILIATQASLFSLDVLSGDRAVITTIKGEGHFADTLFAEDGKTLYAVEVRDGGLMLLFYNSKGS